MRYVFSIVLSAFLMLNAYALPTPEAVQIYYKGMEKLATISDDNSAYYQAEQMRRCFYSYGTETVSGIDLPNDFSLFPYDAANNYHNHVMLTSRLYVDILYKYLFNARVMKVKCEILDSEADGEQPDYNKGSKSLSAAVAFVKTNVRKIYTIDRKTVEFMDVVHTDKESGKIFEIKNGVYVPKGDDKNSLRLKAAQAYKAKRYGEAYGYYKKIIELDAKDADALYRIALMTYYQEGCGISSRKDAHRQGRAYMQAVEKCGNSTFRGKAEVVLHNWRYINV